MGISGLDGETVYAVPRLCLWLHLTATFKSWESSYATGCKMTVLGLVKTAENLVWYARWVFSTTGKSLENPVWYAINKVQFASVFKVWYKRLLKRMYLNYEVRMTKHHLAVHLCIFLKKILTNITILTPESIIARTNKAIFIIETLSVHTRIWFTHRSCFRKEMNARNK